MKKENDLVLFRNYEDPLMAQFHKAMLEEHGIPSVLKDLGFNFPTAFFNDDHAGIKLLVRNRDLQSAFDLMADDDDDFPDEADPGEEIDGDNQGVPDIDFDDDDFDDDADDDDILFDDKEIREGLEIDEGDEIDEGFDLDDLLDESLFDEDGGFADGYELDLDKEDDLD